MLRNLILKSWFSRAAALLLGTSATFMAWAGDTSVTAGNGSVTVTGSPTVVNFPITRTGDLSYDVYLNFKTEDGTAVAGTDYAAAQGYWLLPAGVANLSIPVTVSGSNTATPDKAFYLDLLGVSTLAPGLGFQPGKLFDTGDVLQTQFLSDLNFDGKPDVIVSLARVCLEEISTNEYNAGSQTSYFSVPEQIHFPTDRCPGNSLVADMNGDGKPDIVTADYDGYISVLLNMGTQPDSPPQFAPLQSYSLIDTGHQSQAPYQIATADFNGDGKPDLVEGANGQDVLVLLNSTATDSSTVTLQQQEVPVSPNVTGFYTSVAIADVDGDGKPDLILGDSRNSTVSVLLNTTPTGAQSVSFASPLVLQMTAQPGQIVMADVNSDGKPDLIVRAADNTVSPALTYILAYLNTTTPGNPPSFTSSPHVIINIPQGWPLSPRSIAVADMDGDGRPDLVLGTGGSSAFYVMLNTTNPGDSTVSFIAQPPVAAHNIYGTMTNIGDVDGDGMLDVVAGGFDSTLGVAGFSVFLNATTVGTPASVILSASSLPFGYQGVGITSAAQTVTLTNSGSETLQLSSVTVSTPYAVSSNTCGSSVAGRSSCTIAVTFTPTTTGDQPGTLTITDSATDSPQTVALTGTATSLTLSAANLTFAGQAVGSTSAAQTVTLTNNAGADLNVSGITVSGPFALSANACIGSVPANGACSFSVTFTPTAIGSQTGSVALTDDAYGSPQTIGLSGTGTDATADLSPTSLTFASQALGATSAAQTVTLTNNGNAALNLSSIAPSGPYAISSNTCGSSVAPGGSCIITVTFTPTAFGSQTGSITLTDNAAGSPQTVSLSGAGTGATANLAPTSLAFGNQTVGTASASQTVTLTNNGNLALNLSNIVPSGPYAIPTNTCGSSVAAGASCTLSVTFTPTAIGSQTGTIVITDDAANSPQSIGLSGTGTGPTADLSATSLTFANQTVGTTSAAQSITLTNNGNLALSPSITVSGHYAVANTCGSSLPAGGSCTLSVTFTPTTIGSHTGTILITDNAANSPQIISMSGTGTGPTADLSATSLTFASRAIGTTSTAQTLTLSNNGNVALNLSSIAPSGPYAISSNTCGSSVPAGGSCSFAVTFTPTAVGSQPGSITLTDNAAGGPQTVSLSGTGSGAIAALSPASLAFGNQNVGTTSIAQPVTLTNNGDVTLTISSILASAQYAQSNNCGASLAPNASCTIQVTFTPTAQGSQTGSITLSDNATGGSQTIALTGTGQQAVAALSATSLSFGTQGVGTTSTAQTVTLTNNGNLALANLSIGTPTGPFALTTSSSPCGTSLAAGASCIVQVTFTPAAQGSQTGSIAITDSAANSPQTISLSGTGTQALAGLSATSLTFGSQGVGTTSATQSVTLSNTGNAALSIGSIAASGAYTQTNTCGSSVAAGTSCTIAVTFTPTAIGSQTGSVTISDNAGGSPQTISLTGTGTGATATPSPTSLDFGDQAMGTTSAPQTVTLTNNGNAALNLGSVVASSPYAISSNTCGSSVAAGASCTLSVTFTPTALGAANGSVTITDDAADSPESIALTGTGTGAVVSLTPASWDFGKFVLGSTPNPTKNFTLKNTGNATLNITLPIVKSGLAFQETDTCGSTLAAGQPCIITVTFAPSTMTPAPGKVGSITVNSDAVNSVAPISLSGTATQAQADFIYTGSPNAINFGSVVVGDSSAAKTVTLTNVGTASMTGINASLTGGQFGAFTETDCNVTSLAPQVHCTITVHFVPASVGAKTTTLHVTYRLDETGTVTAHNIELDGTGVSGSGGGGCPPPPQQCQ